MTRHLESCESCGSTILVLDGEGGMEPTEHFPGCRWFGSYEVCPGCTLKPPIVVLDAPEDAVRYVEEAPEFAQEATGHG